MVLIVRGTAVIGLGQQHGEIHPARHQFSGPCQHFLGVSAITEIADQDKVSLGRL